MAGQDKRTDKRAGRLPDLRELPSLSVLQLAKRWAWTQQDVIDCIITGALRAHVLFTANPAQDPSSGRGSLQHYELPPASAKALLTRPRPDFPVELVTKGGTAVTVDWHAVRPGDVRVLREEAERFEGTMSRGQEPSVPLRNNQRHRERCRALAQLLWERDPVLTIEAMIDHDEITRIGQENTPYDRKTVRDWIKDLCPNRAPGRRPTNSPAEQE